MMILPEEWRDIPREIYPAVHGKFEISSLGRVRDKSSQEIKLTHASKEGYKICSLLGRAYRVHRLVACAFIPNPEHKDIVHHRDENPSNNDFRNLKWVTPKEHVYENNINERKNESQRKLYGQINPDTRAVEAVFYSLADLNIVRAGFDWNNISKASVSKTLYRGYLWYKGDVLEDITKFAKYGEPYPTEYPWLTVYSMGYVFNSRTGKWVSPSRKKEKNGNIKTIYIDVYDAKLFPDRKEHLKRIPIKQFIGKAVFDNYDPDTDAIANLDGDLENNRIDNLEVVKGAKKSFNQSYYLYRKQHPRG